MNIMPLELFTNFGGAAGAAERMHLDALRFDRVGRADSQQEFRICASLGSNELTHSIRSGWNRRWFPALLIVDDDKSVRDALSRALRSEGYSVSLAASGGEALGFVAEHDVELIVLDVGMPGIDGLETCRLIRIKGNDLPVLMLTARSGISDRVAGLDAGADDYLMKPFALEELFAMLRALLRRQTVGSMIDVHVSGTVVTVSDTGPGISAMELPFVFDRFWRSASSRSLPGSGLGLSIVKQVVEDHGGTVAVANNAALSTDLVIS